jgi:hypothetical protein
MMKKLTIIVALLFSFNLLMAQEGAEGGTETQAPGSQLPPGASYKSPNKLQNSESVYLTEQKLDKQITDLNKRLQDHSKLFRMKVEIVPGKTVLKKGKVEGDKCVTKDLSDPINPKDVPQEDPTNNCLRLEIFDFLGAEEGLSDRNIGSRSKFIELFYSAPADNDDPELQAPVQVTKIRTRIFVENYKELDNKLSVIETKEIDAEGTHNDQNLTVFYSHDGIPPLPPIGPDGGAAEQRKLKGFGKYTLNVVENTKTNPTRNIFKQTFYIKSLIQFDELFTTIYDANERNANKRYAESNKVMKSSLKY